MVPKVGIEPTRGCPHGILSPARLPVPPLRHRTKGAANIQSFAPPVKLKMEAPWGHPGVFEKILAFAYRMGYYKMSGRDRGLGIRDQGNIHSHPCALTECAMEKNRGAKKRRSFGMGG